MLFCSTSARVAGSGTVSHSTGMAVMWRLTAISRAVSWRAQPGRIVRNVARRAGSGLINATLPGVGALGGGEVADVIPLHASESLPKTALACSSARARRRGRREGHLLRGVRDGQGDADGIFALQTGGVADGGADADHVLAAHHADRVPVFVPVDVEAGVFGRELFDGLLRYHDAVWNRARR
jgi:hypothetical protein